MTELYNTPPSLVLLRNCKHSVFASLFSLKLYRSVVCFTIYSFILKTSFFFLFFYFFFFFFSLVFKNIMQKTYIIDFQAFKDGRNKFIMKELAIISCSANKIVHCIIKPPYGFSSLFSKRKNQVMWLKKNVHGLDWNDGYITPGAAMVLFQETVKDADRLLVKGSERCKFIQNLFPTKVVIDLDDLDCPPAKK